MNHEKEKFDPTLLAMSKQEEVQKFEKVKVYEIIKEKEFNRDPKAMKIGTKWVVTNKGTKKQTRDQSTLGGNGVRR